MAEITINPFKYSNESNKVDWYKVEKLLAIMGECPLYFALKDIDNNKQGEQNNGGK